MQHRADLRAFRDELKGLAILWVVFFHAQLGLSGILYEVQKIGYGGVDIFFFLSGFGLFVSLEKSSGLRGYAVRRAKRLLPAYLPFCCMWLAVMLPMFGLGTVQSLRTAAGNLTMIGFFAGVPKMINWYVSALAVSLLVAPFIHACLSHAKRTGVALLVLLLAAFAVGLCFIGDDRYMAVSRLPVFILGMGFALPGSGKQNRYAKLTACVAALAAGLTILLLCFSRYPELLNDYGVYWHPFVLIAPALCIGLGWLFRKAERARRLFAPLRWLGRASFEIFLFNCWAEVLLKQSGVAYRPFDWAVWSAGSILAGALYHPTEDACVKRVAACRNDSAQAANGEKQA